ncbi:MAG: hypothetical protein KAR80_06805, partial [Rhodospirillaceae bacterium]|nr:hypothetical protein [Rhodospirillaceae bacterium]
MEITLVAGQVVVGIVTLDSTLQVKQVYSVNNNNTLVSKAKRARANENGQGESDLDSAPRPVGYKTVLQVLPALGSSGG